MTTAADIIRTSETCSWQLVLITSATNPWPILVHLLHTIDIERISLPCQSADVVLRQTMSSTMTSTLLMMCMTDTGTAQHLHYPYGLQY